MQPRLFAITILACLFGLLLPSAAFAWSNGPSGANGFGTHDWVLKEADRLAAKKSAGWVRLSVALPKTDDPDTVFHDTYYHVYDVWGSKYGNAPKKVAEYYAKALRARKAGNWTAASRYVGIMAHYYADICNPMHTDQSDAEEAIHSAYESAAQEYTDAPGENRAWVRFNGYDGDRQRSLAREGHGERQPQAVRRPRERLRLGGHERRRPLDHAQQPEPRRQRPRRPDHLDQAQGERRHHREQRRRRRRRLRHHRLHHADR